MKTWKKAILGVVAAALVVVGGSMPAQAAPGSHGTYCGAGTTTCLLTSTLHTTSGNVVIEWHNSNNPYDMVLTLVGPNNYTCKLEASGASKSKVCYSVPAGTMTLKMYKAQDKYAYFGASWS